MNTVVLICGFPASGKTTAIKKYPGYARLNRDTEGGKVSSLLPKLDSLLADGKDVILDNLFTTEEDRAPFVEVAKKHNAKLIADQITTSVEDCQFNACLRMARKYGRVLTPEELKKSKDPNVFPPAVIFRAAKHLEGCTKGEGFDEVLFTKFVRVWEPEYKNKALILDFDGTLRITVGGNDKYPTKLSEQKVLVERGKILKTYLDKGYILCGASNQSGIAKGILTDADAKTCFDAVVKELGVDIDYLYDGSKVPPIISWSRKPMPGMGVHFIEKYKLNPAECIMVGDMTSDATFAKRCGFKFVHADKFFGEIDKK
jgi:HAD superfamily hydrolase (TIGR01662 family)